MHRGQSTAARGRVRRDLERCPCGSCWCCREGGVLLDPRKGDVAGGLPRVEHRVVDLAVDVLAGRVLVCGFDQSSRVVGFGRIEAGQARQSACGGSGACARQSSACCGVLLWLRITIRVADGVTEVGQLFRRHAGNEIGRGSSRRGLAVRILRIGEGRGQRPSLRTPRARLLGRLLFLCGRTGHWFPRLCG
jgi:hypothetical protein